MESFIKYLSFSHFLKLSYLITKGSDSCLFRTMFVRVNKIILLKKLCGCWGSSWIYICPRYQTSKWLCRRVVLRWGMDHWRPETPVLGREVFNGHHSPLHAQNTGPWIYYDEFEKEGMKCSFFSEVSNSLRSSTEWNRVSWILCLNS